LYLDWIREVAGELDKPCNLASCTHAVTE
jgi:hypothetical protein